VFATGVSAASGHHELILHQAEYKQAVNSEDEAYITAAMAAILQFVRLVILQPKPDKNA